MTQPPFTLRPPNLPDDYPQMAAVRNASQPDWPTSAEEMAHQDAQRDPKLYHTQIVAEQGGQIVGLGGIGHDDFSFEEWRYWGGLNVHPQARGQGIGTAIYDELLRQMQERGARELRTGLSDKPQDAAGLAFLEKRGWQRAWERFESELNTKNIDLHAFDSLMQQVEAGGVQLLSLAELASDPERNRKLWELDWLLFQDVPLGTVLTKKELEQWAKEELDDPQLQTEFSFVAVDPHANDPLTGNYVGYSTLGLSPGGFYYIGMTGMRREYRGRGIAKALKVAAMRALDAVGGGLIRTFNDAPNVAMIKMNQELGFTRTAAIYRYELHLGEQ